MAVLISKQDTDITTNEFYRVEAYQLSTFGNSVETLSSSRQIPVTFANVGNCMGIVLMLRSGFTDIITDLRGVTVELQELVAAVWTTRTTVTKTRPQIFTGTNAAGIWITSFEFSTPYAVNTTAGIWRFNIVSSAGVQTRHFDIFKTNGTFYPYAAWCDTQLTPSSGNDFIIFKNYVDITTSFTFKGYLGSVDAVRAYCAWVCTNLDPTADNVAYARILNTIASPVTIGIDGAFCLASHGGFRAGTASAPHQADYVKIQLLTPTLGSSSSYFTDASAFGSFGGVTARHSFFLYGVYPAKKLAIATNARTVGATTIDVDDPSVFAVDDFVLIGKRVTDTDETGIPRHRITGIAGNTLTFTPSLAGSNSRIGARVVKTYNNTTNNTGYGVTMRRVGGTGAYTFMACFGLLSNWYMHGVFFELVFYNGSNNQGSVENPAYLGSYYFKDCLMLNSTALNSYGQAYGTFLSGGAYPLLEFRAENCIFSRQAIFTSWVIGVILSGAPTVNYIGSKMYLTNLIFMRLGANGVANGGLDFPATSGLKHIVDGIYLDGAGGGRSGFFVTGTASTYENIEVWGANGSGTNSGAVRISNLINSTIDTVRVDSSVNGINFEATTVNSFIKNLTLGAETANTTDIRSNPKAFIQAIFKTITGNPTIDATNMVENSEGTEVAFENVNATNVDFVRQPYGDIYRTGASLADTTVHTAGGYALRFRPKSATLPVYWDQDIPTGDIQNKTMTIGIWIKINNAAYWAGTHQMPRLTITYDNGAGTAYSEATQTTAWQYVQVAITPTTTFGQINFRIDAKTDATTTNADFYVDDFSAPLPQGSTLNLGGLDLFSNGLPVGPANFATIVTAADVWAADPDLFGAGTVGKLVTKLLTVAKFLGLKK